MRFKGRKILSSSPFDGEKSSLMTRKGSRQKGLKKSFRYYENNERATIFGHQRCYGNSIKKKKKKKRKMMMKKEHR